MDKVYKKIKDIVESLDYYLYQILYETRDDGKVLSVEIDHDNGIDIDDCVTVSRAISAYLDEADPINESYGLEVTSPGAEKELRNYEEIKRAHGDYVHVETFDQTLEGTLEKVSHDSITIRNKNKQTITILMADITLIRLAIDF